ncbi:MAG: ATP-binding protein [Clostridia bacterium]|nr:ATP-binding protein [Clostridia bacterium]
MILYLKNSEVLKPDCSDFEKITFAEKYAIKGDVVKAIIAYIIMTDENPFSLSLERSEGTGTAEAFAKKDIDALRQIFFEDHKEFSNYIPTRKNLSNEEKRIGGMIEKLSSNLNNFNDLEGFFHCVKEFYKTYGVGSFCINKAFYMQDDGKIVPVSHLRNVSFNDIYGYESQKQKLLRNTAAFANGNSANNVLLYGDSGTGKSTAIKATLNEFFDKGVRMIQIAKHQFMHLGKLTEILKGRNYRFILYMDDLSFEDFETEYKYLKAAIEGGLEEKPENVLIYATSNRRHLIKETFSEREGADDIHRNESIQEKISLSDRFGLSIFYPKPMQSEYFDIVLYLAEKSGICVERNTLIAKAREWAAAHGGYSGRCATQFIAQFKISNIE